ncbi:MAG: DNA-3-methyladenine glycosylase family protein [Gemmatimonadota bacterium]
MHQKAVRHLRRADPVLAGVIDRVGRREPPPPAEMSNFAAVTRSIVYQQLSGKAAATIHGRFLDLFAGSPPSAAMLLELSEAQLRAVGLSGQKAVYVRDLARLVATGELAIEDLGTLDDDAVIRELTRVRGVGRWTAQMFLIFRLARPDVLPELDLGIQKAIQRAWRLRRKPTPERVAKIGRAWAPYRSTATWYLWRSLEATGA